MTTLGKFFILLILIAAFILLKFGWTEAKIKPIVTVGTIVRVNSYSYLVPAYIVVKSPGHEAISLIVDANNTFYVGEKGTFKYDSEANPKVLLSFAEAQ